jgi:hypothetical protein
MKLHWVTRGLKSLWGYQQLARGGPITITSTPRLALESWLQDLRRPPRPKGRIAILAVRNPTWIEWALYCACWMRRLGHAPLLLYSQREISDIYEAPTLYHRFLHQGLWNSAARIPDVTLVNLDQEVPGEQSIEGYRAFAREAAPAVAAYEMHVEEHEEGPLREEYLRQLARRERELARAGAVFETVLRRLEEPPRDALPMARRLLAYSGVIGLSCAAGEACRRLGWDAVYVESWAFKPGHMIGNLNAPALRCDLRTWLEAAGELNAERAQEMDRFLKFQEAGTGPREVADAEWLQGFHRAQRANVSRRLPGRVREFLKGDQPTFLMATNVAGDSATLGVSTIFRSQRAWIGEVVRFFAQRPGLRLLLRAHPDEEWIPEKVRLKMGELAQEAAQGAPNVLVLPGSDDTSSYALIPCAQAGLVWMSTIGVDMVIRGIPVIAAARPRYHGLGIALEPGSREEYFALVLELARAPQRTSPDQARTGRQYLHAIFKDFSYQAFGPQFLGRDLRLSGHPEGGDCETFYRMLAGELPVPSRPRNRAAGTAPCA